MMREIHNCPSTLAEGFDAYCPDAALQLFGGEEVMPFLDFEIDGKALDGTAVALNRISVSGVPLACIRPSQHAPSRQ